MKKILYFLLALGLALFSGMMISCSSDSGDDDAPPAFPEGALAGKFSVSDTQKVHFSRGNLQATYMGRSTPPWWGGRYTWGFADNQYDYIGDAPGNICIDKPSKGEVVDLFGWSTTSTHFGISASKVRTDYSGDFVDWGVNFDKKGTWRTLSSSEWDYLLKKRANASSLCKYGVEVCGKPNCLVIAPDDFTETIADSYDMSSWFIAEYSGLVCLPAAGERWGSRVSSMTSKGSYWTSTIDETSWEKDVCLSVYFSPSTVYLLIGFRYEGYSVRLVTNAK